MYFPSHYILSHSIGYTRDSFRKSLQYSIQPDIRPWENVANNVIRMECQMFYFFCTIIESSFRIPIIIINLL